MNKWIMFFNFFAKVFKDHLLNNFINYSPNKNY